MPDSDELILTQEGIPLDTHINIGRVKDKIWELYNNKSSLVPKIIDDCPVCRGSRRFEGYPCPTYWKLAVSANSGCQICAAIQAAVLEFAFPLWQGDPLFTPLHPSFRVGLNLPHNGLLKVQALSAGGNKLGSVAWVELFSTRTDSPYAVFGVAKDIPPVLDIESCLDFLRPRLQRCRSSHVLCQPSPHISDRPARFLFIDTKADPPALRLVDQEDVKEPYIALSHCWGNKEGIIETLSNSLEKHQSLGIPIADLPNSFRDTAYIAQALNIHYLWIDSLCIIQDNAPDWERESVKMADVYSGALLTVAVTGSANPSGGCLFPRRQHFSVNDPVSCTEITSRVERLKLPPEVRMRYERICHQRIEGRHTAWQEVDTQISPLLTRAWGFQEKILSPRMIHFHGEEMIWECNEEHVCECGYEQLGRHDLTGTKAIIARAVGGRKLDEIWQLWADLVGRYILLDITFETDRLPALAGLGNYLSRILDCTYMAGLWKEDFGRQALWNRDYSTWKPSPSRRAREIPTWTWASLVLISKRETKQSIKSIFDYVDSHGMKFCSHQNFQVHIDDESWRAWRSYIAAPNNGKLQVTGSVMHFTLEKEEDNGDYELSPISSKNHGAKGYQLDSWTYLDISEGPDALFQPGILEVEVLGILVGRAWYSAKSEQPDTMNAIISGDDELADCGFDRLVEDQVLILKQVSPGVFERVGVARLVLSDPNREDAFGSCFQGAECVTLTLK